MEDDHLFDLIGPVVLPSVSELAALVVRGTFQGSSHVLCLVIRNQPAEIERISKNVPALFKMVLSQAASTLANWREIPVYKATGQYSGEDNLSEQFQLSTWKSPATDLQQLALDVLADTRLIYTRKIGDQWFNLERVPDEHNTGYQVVRVSNPDNLITFPLMLKDPADLELLDEVLPTINEWHAQAYYEEVRAGLEREQDLLNTFRSAYYLMELDTTFREEHLSDILELAIALLQALQEQKLDDYADWVAAKSADLAEGAGLYDQAVRALRLGGIVNETLGRVTETRRYYERALALLDRVQNERIKAQVHMSFGISLIVLMAHWESETVRPEAWNRQLQEVLPPAQQYLTLARQAFVNWIDPSAYWSITSIDLDLQRLKDLSGDSLAAVQGLDALFKGNEGLQQPQLYLTALLYRLAALQKLARFGSEWRGSFYGLINEAQNLFLQNPAALRERSILFFTFLGDALFENAQYAGAAEAYQIAYQIQLDFRGQAARPPQPNEAYGGVQSIDLCGKLQRALFQLEEAGPTASDHVSPSLQGLTLAEDARNRFLKRDLALLGLPIDPNLSSLLHQRQRGMHKLLARGQERVDPRILMADYEWFLKRDVGKGDAQELEKLNRFDHLLSPGEIEQVLTQTGPNTAILSFYQTTSQTFLYLLTQPDAPPTIYSLPVTLDQLERAARMLMLGIEGKPSVKPPIMADKPHLRQNHFTLFEQISQHLQPLIPQLEGAENIIISPHGLWHSLPIHAILLPQLWERGCIPALSYTPSLRLLTLLHEREHERQVGRFKQRALTTAYRPADVEAGSLGLFQQSHEALAAQLDQMDYALLAAYGEGATAARFFSDTQLVDLHHILAHGNFEEQQHPLQSSIWLADGPLNAAGLLSEGTRASHVTLQACSIGRVSPGFGDEFWGFSRALLAAGANSLLAPMWHVILDPSTRLLNHFYENWLVQNQPRRRAWGNALHQFYQQSKDTPYQHFFHWAAFRMVGV